MQNLLFGIACALISLGALIAWIGAGKPQRRQPTLGNALGAVVIFAGTGFLVAGALS